MSPSKKAIGRNPFLTLGIIVSAGVLVASGIGYAAASEVAGQVKQEDVFSRLTDRPTSTGGKNILLVGNDDRTGISSEDRKTLHLGQDDYGTHAEPLLIVHLADNGTVGVVSIPRDTMVEIPDYKTSTGSTIAAHRERVNTAYAIGGSTLTVETIEKNTGVRIDHYAQIDFPGFVTMVDSLGGVEVCLKDAVKDKDSGLKLPAGLSSLDGAQSLAYVRARHIDVNQDLGRMKRQQAFLGSVFKKVMSPSILLMPPRLIGFMDAAAASITTDTGLDRAAIWGLMAQMRGVSASAISFRTAPVLDGGSGSLIWDAATAPTLFAQLNTGEEVGSAPKAGSTPVPVVPTVEVKPSSIWVRVYNGSTVSGRGTAVENDLKAGGFQVYGTATTWNSRSDQTIIQYDPRYDTSLKTLQASLPNATTVAVPGLGKTFRIIAGNNYAPLSPVLTADGNPAEALVDQPTTAADNTCN